MSRIAVLGAGYVGLVTAACLAELGHEAACCDTDAAKIEGLKRGVLPFYEPGLPELLFRHAQLGRVRFTADPAEAVPGAEIAFIAVGTPMGPDGGADLTALMEAASAIGRANLRPHAVVALKSTVPAGTARRVRETIRALTKVPFDIASNPEFLREGTAVADFLNAERVVIGADNEAAGAALARLYAPLSTRVVRTGLETAELIKYASNAFLAMKVSFINDMANLCEKLGADVTELAEGVGLDSRIGTGGLRAGIGYGGSCFPKDLQALRKTSEEAGYDFGLLEATIRTNREQPLRFLNKVRSALGGLRGREIAVLGLSYKPGTDDMRSAPSLPIVRGLLKEGAMVRLYDPKAIEAARRIIGEGPRYAESPEEASSGADACLIATEWPEIAEMDLKRWRDAMRHPVIFDGRNLFDPQRMKEAGFDYHSVGRPPAL